LKLKNKIMTDLTQNSANVFDESWFTVNEYEDAINRLGNSITPLQRRMLTAHADAPDCMLSVRQLASAGGYEKSNVTYSQYGRLGRLIASSLGVKDKWKVWTHFIGSGFRTETGELIWEMHPELVEALIRLKWANRNSIPRPVGIDIDDELMDASTESETEREALSQARIGQGAFRKSLLKYWGSCAVTGVSEPTVLRASHIKPWRESSNLERLDPFNGLLLAAHIDALFDVGLITFEMDGQIRLSPLLAAEDLKQLGILPTMRLRVVAAEHESYMKFHQKMFRSGIVLEV
jgi:HNH endonuclease